MPLLPEGPVVALILPVLSYSMSHTSLKTNQGFLFIRIVFLHTPGHPLPVQLINHPLIRPKSIHNPDILEEFGDEYLYLQCIKFVKQVGAVCSSSWNEQNLSKSLPKLPALACMHWTHGDAKPVSAPP